MTRRIRTALFLTFTLLLLFLTLLIYIPGRKEKQLSAVCRVTLHPYYALAVAAGDTVYISAADDDTRPAAALTPDSLAGKSVRSGVFVSREGHFFTTAPAPSHAVERLAGNTLKGRIREVRQSLEEQRRTLRRELEALGRYARIHSTVDDGYNEVMAYFAACERQDTAVSRTLSLLERAKGGEAVLRYAVRVTTAGDTAVKRAEVTAKDRELILARLTDKRLPAGASRLSVYRFGAHAWRSRIFAYNDIGRTLAAPSAVRLEKDEPLLSSAEGGAFINRSGNLCGLLHEGHRISSIRLARLLNEVRLWPAWWYYNLKAFLYNKEEKAVTPKTPAAVTARIARGDSVYEGEIDAKGGKHGYGVLSLPDGTRYEGLWQADTLTDGARSDSLGLYIGRFRRTMKAEGYGVFVSRKGERYCGEWKEGRRDGLGYSVHGDRLVRCGTWRGGVFKGERMVYTPDRVYGIDISRHQHEKGKKRFPLRWDDLRITGLGSGRRVSGRVDYPVSFVYIKATEGRTVFNKYYPADLREARRRGIAAGSYHFYSPLTGGAEQAAWFLKKVSIGASDLPPVLDIEPSEDQIRRMGGETRLFAEITAWLKAVTARTGRKPVLYVSQSFINNHLEKASAYIRSHEVWIARYSEYKPYVHLLHWQLTPYGRVSGIHGEVDINVYNGTKEQFARYVGRIGHK